MSLSSAMAINGVELVFAAVDGLAALCDGSRKGLLETGRGGWVGRLGDGSSKGDAGLLGRGDPARLRKGLLEERLMDRPGEGWSVKPKSGTRAIPVSSLIAIDQGSGSCRQMTTVIGDMKQQSPCMTQRVQ